MYGKVSRLAGWIAIGRCTQTGKQGAEQTYIDKCTCMCCRHNGDRHVLGDRGGRALKKELML